MGVETSLNNILFKRSKKTGISDYKTTASICVPI